jgi:polar amino acid transport system substrate-binding protein
MQSYIELLATKRLDISRLISHTFNLEKSFEAYDMILSHEEPFSGIVIQYDEHRELRNHIKLRESTVSPQDANVGFIGAGSFAQGTLLPNIEGNCNFVGIFSGHGNTAQYVGDKYGFNYLAGDVDEIVYDCNINTVFITTRHNMHAENILISIKNNKHIFVEKPLAINEKELSEIKAVYEKSSLNHLMVGFNRRFAPAIKDLKKLFLPGEPKSIAIRINSGIMPLDHWVNDPDIGGGRVVGEACHFIDLAMFLADSPIISVSADSKQDANNLNNTIIVNLKMGNGSVASINYFANGNKNVPKERIEVFSGGTIAQIDDFKTMKVFGKKTKKHVYKGQDKGHAACTEVFLKSIKEGKPCPIPFHESHLSTLATFKVNQSITENRKILF